MTSASNNDNNTMFDRALDRLVDGELAATERQQFLSTLDDHQEGWRKCALAFLESQAWGQQLKSLVAENENQQPPTVRRDDLPAPNQTGRWLAMAAGLLLAFSLGWFTRSQPLTNESNVGMTNDLAKLNGQEFEQQEVPFDEGAQSLESEDVVTLVVRDASGKNQRVQVPLMEVADFKDDFSRQFRESLPVNLREGIRDRGFDVQSRRRFASVFFEQNKQLVPMVVPVDDTYLVPYERPIY